MSLADVQCHLDKEGASNLVIDLIMNASSDRVFHESILLAIALLEGGNTTIQVGRGRPSRPCRAGAGAGPVPGDRRPAAAETPGRETAPPHGVKLCCSERCVFLPPGRGRLATPQTWFQNTHHVCRLAEC